MSQQRLAAAALLATVLGGLALVSSDAGAGALHRRGPQVATAAQAPAFYGLFPAAFVATLQEPGRSILGRELTAGADPFSVEPSADTGCTGYDCFVATGIAVVLNRDLSPPCGACTYPTVSSDGVWWTMLSGDGATATAGLFSQPTPDLDANDGWVLSSCSVASRDVAGSRGAPIMVATDFDAGSGYDPCGAPGIIGYCWDSDDDVSVGLRFCTSPGSCTSLGVAAPRDDREYCALIAVAACTGAACDTAGYAALVDLTDPLAPVLAHEAVGFDVGTEVARFLERNANPCQTSGCTPVSTGTRYIRGSRQWP